MRKTRRMDCSPDEAVALLNKWRNESTPVFALLTGTIRPLDTSFVGVQLFDVGDCGRVRWSRIADQMAAEGTTSLLDYFRRNVTGFGVLKLSTFEHQEEARPSWYATNTLAVWLDLRGL